MGKFSLMAFVAAIALFVGGCETIQGFLPGDDQEAEVIEPVDEESPTAAVPNNAPGGADNLEETEAVPAPPIIVTPPGLIKSTNAQQRVGEISQGREDPFASIPVAPIIEVEPSKPETNNQTVSSLPSAPSNTPPRNNGSVGANINTINRARNLVSPGTQVSSPQTKSPSSNTQAPKTPSTSRNNTPRTPSTTRNNTPKTPSTTRNNTPKTPSNSSNTKPKPPATTPSDTTPKPPSNGGGNGNTPVAVAPPSQPRFIPELPPPPQPDLAQGVEVTGVVQVGGVPQAIVKAPNEKSSRYVRAGQYLSNGQVLVKRIDMNDGPEPVVILEEKGIEVAKTVGAPATGGLPSDTPPPPGDSKASVISGLSVRGNRS
ncbi:MAG: hypothetical protein SAJ37_12345 [Oscillatoria sp. PMC 1068.18]|nr:hypothetical protein [Oscillatoria sp. PMC 1068.18]